MIFKWIGTVINSLRMWKFHLEVPRGPIYLDIKLRTIFFDVIVKSSVIGLGFDYCH